jgi:intracellular multiplication protein IcmV
MNVHYTGVKIMKKDKAQEKKPRFNFIRRRLRFSEWLGLDILIDLSLRLLGLVKDLVVIQSPEQSESFEQAQAKLGLSATDIELRQQRLKLLTVFMLVMLIPIIAYVIYQALYGSIQATCISIVLACVILGFAFRYHFWFTQFKQRKLGLTFNEWFKYTLSKGD